MPIELGSAYGKIVIDSSGVTKGVKDASNSTNSFASSFKGLSSTLLRGGAIIAGVGVSLKKAFDMAEEGANVIQMGRSFDILMSKVGASPAILDELRQASRGTISDMSLMASTSTLLAGTQGELASALASATPQLIEIAKAANALNPTLGDTTYMYDSLARGIKRSSPLILDNLGIVVSVEAANKAYAESIGVAADALTVEQQKIALLNATLAQGQVMLEQVGGNTASAADGFLQLQASIDNAANALKARMAPGLGNAAAGLAMMIDLLFNYNKMLSEGNGATALAAKSYQDYVEQRTAAYLVTGKMLSSEQEEIKRLLAIKAEVEDYTERYGELTQEKLDALYATEELSVAEYDLLSQYRDTSAIDASIESWDLLTERQYEAALRLGQFVKGESLFKVGVHDATEEIIDQTEAVRDLDQELSDLQTIIGGPLRDEEEDWIERQGDLAENMADVQTEIDGIKAEMAALEDGGVSWWEQGDYDALAEELGGLQGDYADLRQTYADERQAHLERTQGIVFDLLTQRAAMDGLTSDELTLLTTLAERWGMIDEDTANVMSTFDQALTDLAGGGDVQAALDAVIGAFTTIIGTAGEGSTAIAAMRDRVAELYANLLALDGTDVSAQVVVTTVPGGGYTPPINIPMAAGGSFVVPPGYPNDSYVMGLTSGEHVDVRRPGEGGGEMVLNVGPINIYGDADPAAVGRAVVDGGNQVLDAARAKGLR